MLLLIDIFSINRSRGYENPSLDIIVTELCSTRGCPLEEAHEYCSQNQSVISIVILISVRVIVVSVLVILLLFYHSIILFLFCILFISGILHLLAEILH
jgi:hypothetical protein